MHKKIIAQEKRDIDYIKKNKSKKEYHESEKELSKSARRIHKIRNR